MKSPLLRIVILDDDAFDNSLCMLYFKRILQSVDFDIVGFTNPVEGLQFIETEFEKQAVRTIVLLDLSMPLLNGWEVLHQLEKLPPQFIPYLSVYILSYSVQKDDVQKSEESSLVKSYLVKPLTDHLAYLYENIVEVELPATIQDKFALFSNKK